MTLPHVDEHGFLRGVPHHDGLLEAVILLKDRALIGVQSTEGVRHVIELRGLIALSADGVREGNIILNIRLLDGGRVLGEPEVKRLVTERLNVAPVHGQSVFVLEPSYGAEIVSLFTEWSVVRGGFTLTPT